MAETYCGKNCLECAEYQNSLCPGCRQGPGSWLGNDCDIAQCARDKGCATCLGCDSEKTCVLCAGASVMPERRKQRAAAKEAGQALRRQRKDVGKWLWIYFWMLIPNFIAAFMTNNSVVQVLPGLKFPGEILSILVGIAQCVLLFLLAKEEKNYGYAAWTAAGLVAFNILALLVPVESVTGAPRLLTVLLAVLLMIGVTALTAGNVYFESKANQTVLTGVDDALAEKWKKLWKRYWVVLIVLLVGTLVALMQSVFTAVIGSLAVLAASIGMIVVGIQRLIYLYNTAKLFREP